MRTLRMLLAGAAAIAVVAIPATCLASVHRTRTETMTSVADQLQAAYHAAISADVASTVTLPSGQVLWLTGDASVINGNPVWDPHNQFVMQAAPGSTLFQVLHGSYGGGWQQVPNFADADVFWMGAGVVDAGSLYVFGVKANPVTAVVDASAPNWMATFSYPGLAYQGITQIPAGVSAVARGTNGYWLIGTDKVDCSQTLTDCYSAHSMWAATGKVADFASWTAPFTFLAAAGRNLGGVVDVWRSPAGTWTAWTKNDDILGTTISEYTAPHLENGPWTLKSTWTMPTACAPGACQAGWDKPNPTTYGVRVHPGQGEPSGYILVTGIENDYSAGPPASGYYGPQFMDLPY